MKSSIIIAMFIYKMLGSAVEISATQNLPIINSDQIICSFCETQISNYYPVTAVFIPINNIKKACNSSYDIKNRNEYSCGFKSIKKYIFVYNDTSIRYFTLKQSAIKKNFCTSPDKERDIFCPGTSCADITKCCNGNLCNDIDNS